jgi:hypothetical protein
VRDSRTKTASPFRSNDFGRQMRIASSLVAVSSFSRSWHASSCCVVSRFASVRSLSRFTP